jgi:energy-coupling factor transporter ATP-binding protein EcfA2
VLAARGLVVAPAGRAPHERVATGPLDLEVHAGDWLTLRGGNGAGKSTLLLTLAGLLSPVAGTVRLAGHDPFSTSAGERRAARAAVGLVFQEPETQSLTDAVFREIAFPLENLGWDRATIDARVDELIGSLGLEAVRAAPPGHLSGGEAQRVALAAAMAPHPGLLLLDEPDSYLDPAGRAALQWALAALRERHGTAIVWSTCEAAAPGPPGSPTFDLGPGLPGGGGPPRPESAPAATSPPVAGGEPAVLWRAEGLRLERRDERGGVELWGGLGFAIGRGDRVAVVGGNGSGKTALLDALAGLVEGGRTGILEAGIPSGGLGYLTQFPESQLFAETVRDDVAFALRHRRPDGVAMTVATIASRTDEAIALVGLDPERVGDRPPDALSLGERRRVALAGVLVAGPAGVLLDEPTAGLDAPGRRDLEEALDRAGRAGATLVVATHDPGWVGRSGWRIVPLPAPRRTPGGGPRGS